MKKYIIFDLDWTLINSHNNIKEIIFEYFKINDLENYDNVRFTMDFNKIASVKDLLVNIYWENHIDIEKNHVNLYKYLDEKNHESEYIKWTIEKIKQLKDNYKFYLSTWSSTKFAKEVLKKWWILKYFELIQWSDVIPKSEEHLDIFLKHSGDINFFELSYSIWDSEKDEYFAKQRNIDFIKIWEINKSIADIKNI